MASFTSLPTEIKVMILELALGPPAFASVDIARAELSAMAYDFRMDRSGARLNPRVETASLLYSRRPAPVAQVCRLWRGVALKHLAIPKRHLKSNPRRWEREEVVYRPSFRPSKLTPKLVIPSRMLRGGFPILIEPMVQSKSGNVPHYSWSLLAFEDHQIKARHAEELTITTNLDTGLLSTPYVRWFDESPRLVDVRDTRVFKDLAKLHRRQDENSPPNPPVLQAILDGPESREQLVSSTLGTMLKQWETMFGTTRAPPKIDVVIAVHIRRMDSFKYLPAVPNPPYWGPPTPYR